jgi:hypothetical protein
MRSRIATTMVALAGAVLFAALAASLTGCGDADEHGSVPRPSITVHVDDTRISAPARVPAGDVDVHIVTSGKVQHHLAFWHLNDGVTLPRFVHETKLPNGDPFKLGTAVGGNAPMLAGRFDTTMKLVPGRVVVADIVDGPTTRFANFAVVGPERSTQPPAAVGTIDNRDRRFDLPADFGRPGVYRFTNSDPVPHDGVIYSLAKGETANDLVGFLRSGGKGRPPVDFESPLGGPGVTAAHWSSSFKLPKLPPGRYVMACFLPDPGSNVPHAAEGMAAGFVVP